MWSKASSARMFIIQHLAWIPKIFEAELEELMGAAKEIAKVVANDLLSHTLSVFAVYVLQSVLCGLFQIAKILLSS